jgi:hypothetical protein
VSDVCRFLIHGLVTDDGVAAPPTQVVFASDYDALADGMGRLEGLMMILRAQHQLVRDDANAATLRCAELALENGRQAAEIARLKIVEGEWMALSQDDGKVERALESAQESNANLRNRLRGLVAKLRRLRTLLDVDGTIYDVTVDRILDEAIAVAETWA